MRPFYFSTVLALALVGCGSSDTFPTAKVSGQVLCKDEPIKNLIVHFRPMNATGKKIEVGKVGDGLTDEEGKFNISTYGKEDGAVIGKCQIIVDAPVPDGEFYLGCDCETHSQKWVEEVDVVARKANHFVINLKPKTKKSLPSINPKDLADMEPAAN